MNKSILLTPHVLNTINALPTEQRISIATAIAGELILGANIDNSLSGTDGMVYAIIRDYIMRDSAKALA